jgi:hypothetical protein
MVNNTDNNIYPAQQPLQTVEEEKWTEQYYIQNARWICSMYNQRVMPTYLATLNNTIPDTVLRPRFVDLYYKYSMYVFGQQQGTSYELTAKDVKNNNTQIPLYRGKDIASLFKFFNGKIRDMIRPIPKIMQANTIGGEALSRKRLKLDILKHLVDAKNFLAQEQESGNIEIQSDDDLDLSSEQMENGVFQNFKESSEKTYLKISKNFFISNDAYKKFVKGGEYMFIGGVATAFVEERNGKIYLDVIPPQYSIVDRTKDDDLHDEDQYAGQVRPYSVSEIAAKWNLTPEEAEDLERIGRDNSSQLRYTDGWTNLNWYTNNSGVPKVWVAEKLRWQSIVYIDGVPTSCIRTATLIGNKYLKDEGILPNSVLHKTDFKRKKLGYITCTPNVIMSANLGVIGLIHEMQDIKDSLITMMLNSVARAIGKAIYIDTSQLPEGLRAPEFLQQLKQHGVVAANRAEIDDIQKSNPLIEVMDLTIDPNINALLNQVSYWDNALADVMNVPKNVKLGSNDYQSSGQIANNIQTSDTGTKWLYDSLALWIKETIEYGASLTIKTAETDGGDIAVLIGDTAAEMLKSEEVQKCLESSYQIHLDFDNSLTEQIKATLAQITVQEAGVNPDAKVEYINILRKDTLDDVNSYLMTNKRKREAQEAAIRKEQQEAALAQTQTMVQGQQQIADQQSNAKLTADQMKIEGKQDEIVLKSELENTEK